MVFGNWLILIDLFQFSRLGSLVELFGTCCFYPGRVWTLSRAGPGSSCTLSCSQGLFLHLLLLPGHHLRSQQTHGLSEITANSVLVYSMAFYWCWGDNFQTFLLSLCLEWRMMSPLAQSRCGSSAHFQFSGDDLGLFRVAVIDKRN